MTASRPRPPNKTSRPNQNPQTEGERPAKKSFARRTSFPFKYFGTQKLKIFVSTSKGLEQALCEEISDVFAKFKHSALRAPEAGPAGVMLSGDWKSIGLLNLTLRTASRVLWVLGDGDVSDETELKAALSQIPWTELFDVNATFAVSATCKDSFYTNSNYLSMKVKDVIVDTFRDVYGKRPSVELRTPDVQVFVRLVGKSLSVSLDTTGEPLSRRHYRAGGGDAPLQEALAAGLLRMAGWSKLVESFWKGKKAYFERASEEEFQGDRKIPAKLMLSPYLLDPMTGTGTFAIEAALEILSLYPSAQRKEFAFDNIKAAKPLHTAFRQIKAQVLASERSIQDFYLQLEDYIEATDIEPAKKTNAKPIVASDKDKSAIAVAKESAELAGVAKLIDFQVKDVADVRPHANVGLLVVNPPYGERLDADEGVEELYRGLGTLWKHQFAGWTSWALSSNETAIKAIGLRATRKSIVYNSNLACRFLQYALYGKDKG